MGKFKDVGEPSLVLMEELAEAIQVIAKKHRFQEDWNSYAPSDVDTWPKKTRWEELQAEMADVFYQWFRLKEQVGCDAMLELSDWECSEGTLHSANEECDCENWSSLTEADFWDGDNSPSE
jgi:NTP pyrophosphatase (non-canonical NTP hydrolase)